MSRLGYTGAVLHEGVHVRAKRGTIERLREEGGSVQDLRSKRQRRGDSIDDGCEVVSVERSATRPIEIDVSKPFFQETDGDAPSGMVLRSDRDTEEFLREGLHGVFAGALSGSAGNYEVALYEPPPSSYKDSKVWWTGLSDQKVAILDDIRPESFPHHLMLRLADSMECFLEIKGASASFTSSILFVTTPEPPWRFWPSLAETEVEQVVRRLTCVVEFTRKSPSTTSPWTTAPSPDTVAVTLNDQGFVLSASQDSVREMAKWRSFVTKLASEERVEFARKCAWFVKLAGVDETELEWFREFSNFNYSS